MTSPRWIDLDGVANMRDLGGLPTRDGRETRPGRLIRSDNLQDLSDGDVHHLVDVLGVTDVVDLRSETERTVTGPGPLSRTALTHHHHSFFVERERAATADDALALPWSESSADDDEAGAGAADDDQAGAGAAGDERRVDRADPDFWTSHYLGYLSDRPDSVSAALSVIATSAGGTVVHCAAGKDRTGTVTALALSVAGVPDEEIVADYAASAERIERIVQRLAAAEPYATSLAGRSLDEQTPQPETMAEILVRVRDDLGGAADWLRAQGWSEDQVDRLRRALLT